MKIPLSFEKLIGLHNLLLDSCENLEFVSDGVICTRSLRKLTLRNCPHVKMPDWLSCLSSLVTLSLTGNCIDRIPPNIKNLSVLIELYISNRKNLRSLPELPLSLGLLHASGCTSLKTVANSKTALLQCRWSDNHVTYRKKLLFCECSNLDPISRHNLLIESQIKILRMATISASQPMEISRVFDEKPFASFCCPGNEIPKWFIYQSEGSSTNIVLPPNWHNNNFIGFSLCAIVGENNFGATLEFEVNCEYYFKTSNGKSPKFHCKFQEPQKREHDSRAFIRVLKSDHVLMWYDNEDYRDYLDAIEVSFEFHFVLKTFDVLNKRLWYQNIPIGRCGIRLLYLQDMEEIDIIYKAKPNGDVAIDSDTYEPHAK